MTPIWRRFKAATYDNSGSIRRQVRQGTRGWNQTVQCDGCTEAISDGDVFATVRKFSTPDEAFFCRSCQRSAFEVAARVRDDLEKYLERAQVQAGRLFYDEPRNIIAELEAQS